MLLLLSPKGLVDLKYKINLLNIKKEIIMVTKQQFRVTTDTLTPLYKASVGFDQMVNEFFNAGTLDNTSGYPPYNISKDSNDVYEITLAVAGFKRVRH